MFIQTGAGKDKAALYLFSYKQRDCKLRQAYIDRQTL